ncbi:hypothetical protein [Streptococcus massiliensis]|uniref:Excreted peptide n=1 Tax=Streptococcus massiliensis TaxID=313439 RepID=A0A380KYF6_9STRE|nr:hypothetical protein [Streptococcus massiliensis]SUN77022.1 excreted peptide [Streptococcus massiliensis]
MKKNILLALIQGIVIFIIAGVLCMGIKGDFFYQYLAPIFGLLAALLRFISASIFSVLSLIHDKNSSK